MVRNSVGPYSEPFFPSTRLTVRGEGTDQLVGIQSFAQGHVFRTGLDQDSPHQPILLLCSSDQLRPLEVHPPAGQPRAWPSDSPARAAYVAIPTACQVSSSAAPPRAQAQAPWRWQQASGPHCPSKPGREAVRHNDFPAFLHVCTGILLSLENIEKVTVAMFSILLLINHWAFIWRYFFKGATCFTHEGQLAIRSSCENSWKVVQCLLCLPWWNLWG